MAVFVTNKVGSMGFFFLMAVWTVFWISWNTFGPGDLIFDSFPAFVLWLFISNMIQIFLMPLIMIGQNLQSRHAEIMAEADFEINLKAEQEIETIMQQLKKQGELLDRVLERLDSNRS